MRNNVYKFYEELATVHHLTNCVLQLMTQVKCSVICQSSILKMRQHAIQSVPFVLHSILLFSQAPNEKLFQTKVMGGSPGELSEHLPNLQPFRHFTYVTTHSPSLLSLYLRHSSFSNPSVPSPTS